MSSLFFDDTGFQNACIQALENAIGRRVIVANTQSHSKTAYRQLVRVGLLGPAIGGQCILDIPLLTALNLSSLSICNKNFSDINAAQEYEDLRKHLLGIPVPNQESIYQCHDPWVKTIDISLGPLYLNESFKITINEPVQKDTLPEKIKLVLEDGPSQTYYLNTSGEAAFELKGFKIKIRVIDTTSIALQIDESGYTLDLVPSIESENQILTTLDNQTYLIKGGGSLVKSRLLELANQICPSLIPENLTADMSTPQLIPSHQKRLPLPKIKKYQTFLLVLGVGPIKLQMDLCNISELKSTQIEILKSIFDFTFYHPELKKIFG